MSSLNLTVALEGNMDALLDFVRGLKEYAGSHAVNASICVTGQLDVSESFTVTMLLDREISDVFSSEEDERPRNSLRRAGINTLGDLVEKTEDDLLAIANFGQKSLDQVIAKLGELGLKLKQRS